MSKKIYAFIFARGGSKGLINKNIKTLGGLPLIAHSIKLAGSISQIDKLFVSTDSEEIASIASFYGAEIIKRPLELAKDDSPEWDAWQHAINFVLNKEGDFDVFISLPATSPLRSKEDVIRCLDNLDSDTDVTLAIRKSDRSPWFNMVKKINNNQIELIFDTPYLKRRQDVPTSYDITTIAYVSRPGFILNSNSIWDGLVKGIEVSKVSSIDIDDKVDFKIAQILFDELN